MITEHLQEVIARGFQIRDLIDCKVERKQTEDGVLRAFHNYLGISCRLRTSFAFAHPRRTMQRSVGQVFKFAINLN